MSHRTLAAHGPVIESSVTHEIFFHRHRCRIGGLVRLGSEEFR